MRRDQHFVEVKDSVSLHVITSQAQCPIQHPILFLLHFWGGSNKPLINHLSPDFNIIAPSLRGWGESSKPIDAEAYRITDYVEDIVRLVKHYRTEQPDLFAKGLVILGHSMGGKIAQVLLTREEFAHLIKGLILVAPAPAGSFALPAEMQEQQVHAYDNLGSAQFVIEKVLLGRSDAVSDATVHELAADAVAGSSEAKAAWPAYGMAEDHWSEVAAAIRGLTDSHRRLKVLVVLGSLDRVETRAAVEERTVNTLLSAGAQVEFELLDGVGHLSPVEATDKLAMLVRNHATTL